MSDRVRRLLPRSKAVRVALGQRSCVLVAAAALGGYLYERHRTGSIYHPHARFVPQPTPTLPTRGPGPLRLAALRLHQEPHPLLPRPRRACTRPSGTLWVRNGHSLLEFPPVIYGDHIFQLADDGVLIAINKHTGHTFWTRRIGRLSASTPAVGGSTVYVTVLARGTGSNPGGWSR